MQKTICNQASQSSNINHLSPDTLQNWLKLTIYISTRNNWTKKSSKGRLRRPVSSCGLFVKSYASLKLSIHIINIHIDLDSKSLNKYMKQDCNGDQFCCKSITRPKQNMKFAHLKARCIEQNFEKENDLYEIGASIGNSDCLGKLFCYGSGVISNKQTAMVYKQNCFRMVTVI